MAVDPEHLALLGALSRHGVEFVVIGGVAAQLNGWREATVDLDISIDLKDSNLARLDVALASVNARNLVPGVTGTTMMTDHGRLEIINQTDGVAGYAEWARGATAREVATGLVIAVAAKDDILRSKEAAGRSKDQAVLDDMRRDFGVAT